jgi:hypothetical protein
MFQGLRYLATKDLSLAMVRFSGSVLHNSMLTDQLQLSETLKTPPALEMAHSIM